MSFLDNWKEWSTAKKVISIVAVCCIGLFIVGMIAGGLSPDKNTGSSVSINTNSSDSSSNSVSNSSSDSSSPLQVRITTEGSWSGALGTTGSTTTYDGTGSKTIDLDGSSYEMVTTSIQKQGGGSDELKVEIIKDGKVVKEGSTTAQYGVVSIAD